MQDARCKLTDCLKPLKGMSFTSEGDVWFTATVPASKVRLRRSALIQIVGSVILKGSGSRFRGYPSPIVAKEKLGRERRALTDLDPL